MPNARSLRLNAIQHISHVTGDIDHAICVIPRLH